MPYPTLTELPPPPPGKTGWPWTEASPPLPDLMPDGSPWPRVTIVTPSYNQGEFIEETIRSVLLQGYPNLEYIIMDGGSTDNSVEIIRKYERWLAYWVSEPDRGQSDAINKGWRMATGEVLAYLNSDDIYYPGAIRSAVECFLQHPEVGMVYGDSNIVDETGTVVRRHRLHQMTFPELLDWFDYIPQPTAFLRREVIATVGMTDTRLHYAMDYDLWLRVGLRFGMNYIPQLIASERRHSRAKTSAHAMKTVCETTSAVEQFFSRNLPAATSALKDRTLAVHYLRMAQAYYGTGEMSVARAWTIKALRLHRRVSLAWWGAAVFAKSLLGSRLSAWLRQVKHQGVSARRAHKVATLRGR